jgi:DNA-binding IclR family transcriptional regulator
MGIGMSHNKNNNGKNSSITRVLALIETIAASRDPVRPADLIEQLGIPKPSLHRLLQQLEAEGYLYTNLRGMVVPDERLCEIGFGVLYSTRFRALRQATLQTLSEKVGETCGISIPDGSQMRYYDRYQSNWPLQLHLPVGSRTPLWATASGKLYLASLPPKRRNALIDNLPLTRLARNTITDTGRLKAEIDKIASTKIGLDNEEFVDGMNAISVPIYDHEGRVFACLFTHAPIIRKNLDELLSHLPAMHEAADTLGKLKKD